MGAATKSREPALSDGQFGLAAQALVLFAFWKRAGLRYRPDFRWRGVGLGATGKAAGWVFGMVIVTQLAGIVHANVASLSAAGGEPSLAVLRFSWLIFMLPHSVVTVSLATAYFTRMSAHARDGGRGAGGGCGAAAWSGRPAG